MSKIAPPARLYVIPAAEAEVAVVFRRGPSDWYLVLSWDIAQGKVEFGSWFHGRIYAEKCDLSPDGQLLLYFVHQGGKMGSDYTDAWSGVSRLPWLTALGAWPQGTTYGGGGRFLSNRHLVLRASNSVPLDKHPAAGLQIELGNAAMHASTAEVEGADWTGRDCTGRLLIAREGKLLRRLADGSDLTVIDLNGLVPDPKPAPASASVPIGKSIRAKNART